MKKIIIKVAILFFCICSVIVLYYNKRSNHRIVNEEYMYDSVSPECNYSENNVMYIDGSGILHMIDTASGKDIVYCDRPDCEHEPFSHNNENPSCPAVFAGLNYSGAVLYNNHLYFIGNMSNEGLLNTQYLYEMDSNGENRKIVATLEDIQDIKYVLYRDKYVIGAYSNRCELNDDGQIINDNKPEAGIFVVNLDNYKVYLGEKITGEQANITGIYYENGAVYYSSVRFGDDITELMVGDAAENDFESFCYENMLQELYKYDLYNDNTVLVKSFDHISYFRMLEGNVYYATKEGYFVFDHENGETKELAIDKDSGLLYGGIKKHEEDLYYALFDDAGNKVTYYRIKNGKTEELLTVPSEDSFGIANICGNSVYINYTNDNGKFCLGVLDLDDFNNGKFIVKELRYYNEEE